MLNLTKDGTIYLPVEIRSGQPIPFEVVSSDRATMETIVNFNGGCPIPNLSLVSACSDSECAISKPCSVMLGDETIGNFYAPIGSKGTLSQIPKLKGFWVRASFAGENRVDQAIGTGVASVGTSRVLVRSETHLKNGSIVSLGNAIVRAAVSSSGSYFDCDGCCWQLLNLDRSATGTYNLSHMEPLILHKEEARSFFSIKPHCGIFGVNIRPSQSRGLPDRGTISLYLEQGWSRSHPVFSSLLRSESFVMH